MLIAWAIANLPEILSASVFCVTGFHKTIFLTYIPIPLQPEGVFSSKSHDQEFEAAVWGKVRSEALVALLCQCHEIWQIFPAHRASCYLSEQHSSG